MSLVYGTMPYDFTGFLQTRMSGSRLYALRALYAVTYVGTITVERGSLSTIRQTSFSFVLSKLSTQFFQFAF
jgi:hypothetical protein